MFQELVPNAGNAGGLDLLQVRELQWVSAAPAQDLTQSPGDAVEDLGEQHNRIPRIDVAGNAIRPARAGGVDPLFIRDLTALERALVLLHPRIDPRDLPGIWAHDRERLFQV